MGARGPLAGALLALTLTAAGCSQGQTLPPAALAVSDRTGEGVTVTGVGRTTTPPDTMRATLGAEVASESLSEAFTGAADAAERVIAELQERGVAQEDIRTVDFSVRPQRGEPGGPAGRPEVTGYVVTNLLEVTIRDVDTAGEILAGAVDAAGGAARVQGVRFAVEDAAEQLREARRAAFADARAKAEQYAELAGGELGELLSVTEGAGPPPPAAESATGGAGDAVPPIQPGQQTVDVQVQVTWDLQ